MNTELEIVQVAIGLLKEAEYNPRTISRAKEEQIRRSLTKFGFVEPVVVNKHRGRLNIIVGGHQRVRIAKELSIATVPVVYVSLTLEQEKELNIRLNDGGDWDYEKMRSFVAENILLDTGFGDVLTSESPEVITRTPGEGRSRKTTVEGAEGRTVTVKVGSLSTSVPERTFLEWKERMHIEHGFSEDMLAREVLRRLGLGEPSPRRRGRRLLETTPS